MFRKLFRRSSRTPAPVGFHPDRPPPGSCSYDAPPPGYSAQASETKQTKETKEANRTGEALPDPPSAFEPFDDGDNDQPPPAFHALYHDSPTSNAPAELAEAGWAFTDTHALGLPRHLPPAALAAIQAGALDLAPPPPRFRGSIAPAGPMQGAGESAARKTVVESAPGCPDTCLLSALPLYAAGYVHPLRTGRAKAIYFEAAIQRLPDPAVGAIALGFCAQPYPGFRLPGWNRGSLAVHSDDGRRFANDSYGGKTFLAEPVRAGETLGIGMRWAPREGGVDADVWVTRDGVCVGGWRLDEPRDRDEENDPLPGLDGVCDVYAAVGVWGGPVLAHLQFFTDGQCPGMPS